MGARDTFGVAVPGGELRGWTAGSGPNVLLLHGGPGLDYAYLDGLGAELEPEFHVAAYQQRGLEPSTVEGPFTIAQAIDDTVAVLDCLGWPQAFVVGHSWGGHLALRLVAARPQRLLGALAVEPLGVVGDGGMAAFAAEMQARTAKEARDRAQELDERAMAGQGTLEDAVEGLRLYVAVLLRRPREGAADAADLDLARGVRRDHGGASPRASTASRRRSPAPRCATGSSPGPRARCHGGRRRARAPSCRHARF